MTVERLAFHAEMVALMQDGLTANARWSHGQILTALQPLVAAQRRPPEPQRRPLGLEDAPRRLPAHQLDQLAHHGFIEITGP